MSVRALLAWLLTLAAILMIIGVIVSAFAYAIRAVGAHEAQLADERVVDYEGLKSPAGSDCCGNRDCQVVEWRELDGGRLEVQLPQFGWVPVPMDKVLPPHPDAPDLFHVCYRQNSQVIRIYCVFPVGWGS